MSKKIQPSSQNISVSPVYLSARSAVVQPERAIAVTHYSLNKWLPKLGAGRWALVQYLRGLCIDSPRRPDGTKRVTISWRMLAEYIQVHEETIASWLKHEVIPDDKPWRRIAITDDSSKYLSLFIPRLRYAYESHNGKTRRVGFLLEVLMEDPIVPEDELRLQAQVEQMQMQQGTLSLQEAYPSNVNPKSHDLPDNRLQANGIINPDHSILQPAHHYDQRGFTVNKVNPKPSDLHPNVKHTGADLQPQVNTVSSDLWRGKPEITVKNVNKLKTYIDSLIKNNKNHRNTRSFFAPLVSETEAILNDYHSSAMLYKVLKAIFPSHMHLYLQAVEDALLAFEADSSVNKGAVFVQSIKENARGAGIDLGFQSSGESSVLNSQYLQNTEHQPLVFEEVSELEAIWSETLNVLRGQMTRAMFNSVMQDTQLVSSTDNVYIVSTNSAIALEWLNNRLKNIVIRALNSVVGNVGDVQFKI